MLPHRIIKSFPGSNDGIEIIHFAAGEVAPLSDDLARIAVAEGWAKPVSEEKAPEPAIPAESRETKVVEPEETKPDTLKLKKK